MTRATDRAGELTGRLEALGARVVEVAVTMTEDPSDGGVALRREANNLAHYDWVVLASRNAARRLLACSPPLELVSIAAVGPGTAAELQTGGVVTALIPDRNTAVGLVDAFPSGGGRVLLPQAAEGRPVLAAGLREKGWEVVVVEAYRTVPVADPLSALTVTQLGLIDAADAVIVAAPSAARAWAAAIGDRPFLSGVAVISMGRTTTQETAALGLRVAATAEPSTIDGLVDAVARALQ